MDRILLLEAWYRAQCNGDWEHQHGVKIDTLDNPGWLLHVSLQETPLENAKSDPVFIDRTDDDWVHCGVSDGVFAAYGGPRNLHELLDRFLQFAGAIKE